MTKESTDEKQPKPKGIGAILTSPDGHVLAHAFDFERSTPGGFKLWEGQRHRAKLFVIRKFIREFTYAGISVAIEDYDAERIVGNLVREHKWRLTYVNVGHDIEDMELNR